MDFLHIFTNSECYIKCIIIIMKIWCCSVINVLIKNLGSATYVKQHVLHTRVVLHTILDFRPILFLWQTIFRKYKKR